MTVLHAALPTVPLGQPGQLRRELKQGVVSASRQNWSGKDSLLSLPKEIPLFALNMNRPRPCSWGNPGPHTCSAAGGPHARTHSRLSCNEFRGVGSPLPTCRPWVPKPSRAGHAWAPASHASVRLSGVRERLQSGRDAAAEARAGANSPQAGRCTLSASTPRCCPQPARRKRGA